MSLIGRDEALSKLTQNENHTEILTTIGVLNKLEDDKEKGDLRATEYNQILLLRGRWSKWILVAVLGISLFDIFLIFFIGAGWLEFKNQIIVPAFIGDSLLKVLGLAFIIVRFLFRQPLSNNDD